MSSSSKSEGDNSINVEELLEIETRCRELRKEKEMLKESQSQGFELIRSLEIHVKSLSEARVQDKKHIKKLEGELKNCSQEIDYLQDQLSARNEEVNFLTEHVHDLEIKLADKGNLQEKVDRLIGELNSSNSDRLSLMQEIENKEEELQQSALCIEKLEESVSSMALESQCEIESMKLDITALEQVCLEAKKTEEEKSRMNILIEELEVQLQNALKIIEGLDDENKELRGKLITSEKNAKIFCQKIKEWLKSKDRSQLNMHSVLGEQESMMTISKDISGCKELFSALLSEVALLLESDADSKEQYESMSHQINEYELLVKQLKDELREQKLKAKEEAEDLAQEMAELRYRMMGLLEEECKRRACIEQASLQRIAELEAQIQKEPKKSDAVVRHLHES
ncbi:PREDICTED: unconventional myosin-XVIIIa isoform X1 [Theobroma cacao]|uniref:Unconventional myosin-XVIIIa isoform X1 n=1 Tax=Theobroma cacao TaxID=3641 RepID=A0AB32W2G0_THECC|nr:PREDICTED: unconventional myosin-XVIIIa isoform X1 [Theobroma cacao]XP_017972176.1 PREDICTED: unconventional myosin-XVIIIa isoform X1 [Theobroma cacao]